MTSIGVGYDLTTSQFSPEGRVFQVEYARQSVNMSGTVLGLKGKDTVVTAVEKILTSSLHEADSNSRIFTVEKDIGITVAGLLSDGKAAVNRAMVEATAFKGLIGTSIPVKTLQEKVAGFLHAHTQYGAVRPLGCCLLVAGCDGKTPRLYMVEPSGASYGYWGVACGKGAEAATCEIEKLDLKKMTGKQLVEAAARIVYQVHDDVKDKQFKLEMSWAGVDTGGKYCRVPEDMLKTAETHAKDELEEDSESDG